MAVLRIDPPPASDDPAVLRRYIADLYDALTEVIYNIDTDNISEEFIKNLRGEGENGL